MLFRNTLVVVSHFVWFEGNDFHSSFARVRWQARFSGSSWILYRLSTVLLSYCVKCGWWYCWFVWLLERLLACKLTCLLDNYSLVVFGVTSSSSSSSFDTQNKLSKLRLVNAHCWACEIKQQWMDESIDRVNWMNESTSLAAKLVSKFAFEFVCFK